MAWANEELTSQEPESMVDASVSLDVETLVRNAVGLYTRGETRFIELEDTDWLAAQSRISDELGISLQEAQKIMESVVEDVLRNG